MSGNPHSTQPIRSSALPFATSLLFAGGYVAGKYTTVDLTPLTVSLLRYLVALGFLLVLGVLRRPADLFVRSADLGWMIFLGLSGIVGYHYFFFTALRHTAVANTAIINAGSPVITGVLAAVVLKERLAAINYVGVVTALIGVAVLLARGDPGNLLALDLCWGDLLMLLAVVSFAAYTLALRHLSARYGGFTLTFWATLTGTILLAVLAGTWEHPVAQVRRVSGASLLAVLYMGIGGSGLGYLLFTLTVRRSGPTRTSSLVYSLVPVCVALLAWLFFGERITAVMLASMLLILAGLHLVIRSAAGKSP